MLTGMITCFATGRRYYDLPSQPTGRCTGPDWPSHRPAASGSVGVPISLLYNLCASIAGRCRRHAIAKGVTFEIEYAETNSHTL